MLFIYIYHQRYKVFWNTRERELRYSTYFTNAGTVNTSYKQKKLDLDSCTCVHSESTHITHISNRKKHTAPVQDGGITGIRNEILSKNDKNKTTLFLYTGGYFS